LQEFRAAQTKAAGKFSQISETSYDEDRGLQQSSCPVVLASV